MTPMTMRPFHTILWHLRNGVSPPPGRGVTDADLLRRFVSSRDESAFELLVCRHGPMVLAACGRVLSDPHAQEDAFQATFLTLVRKAGSIGKYQSVGSWLYKVAYRVALRARARLALQRRREQQLPDAEIDELACTPIDEIAWRELRPLLDREVQQLPEKYRTPFVLCYLEGKTNEEAAREMGCPEGTVYSRLAWARARLRDRLSRRGVLFQAAPLASLLERKVPAREDVPRGLTDATTSMAVLLATGKAAGQVSGSVLGLGEALLKEMWLAKVKLAAAVLLAVATTCTTALIAYQAFVGRPWPVRTVPRAQPGDTGFNAIRVPGTGR
jgi:RNA polymerase sigma factor (sigma-70 family)